ncbi:MAG: restriction endonuclease, partial [Elusimicrobiota bacterium]|nr:restriction endonuclease [Elusimicrobiota bacterium]
MNNKIKDLINEAVKKIIENSSSQYKIEHLQGKHEVKIHFIPKRYRIFGGILQSMNIQFGNFIEVLMSLFVGNDGRYEILSEYSGKKSNSFELSSKNDALIDNYITRCQTENINIENEFPKLLKLIISDTDKETKKFKHDIDLLFKNRITGKIYYLECKYNDDHDTGKFVDINRKFI